MSTYKAGINHLPSYQISSIPFVTSSQTNEVTSAVGSETEVKLPTVSRWFQVTNTNGTNALRLGFSANGVNPRFPTTHPGDGIESMTANYIVVAASGSSPRLEARVKSLFFSTHNAGNRAGGDLSDFSLVAGLTMIESGSFPTLTGSLQFPGIG